MGGTKVPGRWEEMRKGEIERRDGEVLERRAACGGGGEEESEGWGRGEGGTSRARKRKERTKGNEWG